MTQPSVPTGPDGTINFNAPVPVQGNQANNIWYADLPADLQNQPGSAGPLKLWFNIGSPSRGHIVKVPNTPVPVGGSSGDISELNSAIPTGEGTHDVLVGAHGSSENMSTPADILKQMAALQYNDPQALMNIQALMAPGAWGTVNVNGVFDAHTEKALIAAMVQYHKTTNSTGAAMSFMQYLQSAGTRALQAQEQQKMAGSSIAARPLLVDDPAMIAATAESAAQSALGEFLSQDQINKFTAEFQAEQRNAQSSRYYDIMNRTSGTVSMPDLSAQAMAFVQSQNPGAYQENNRTQYLDALVNMLGGNRPSASEPVAPVTNGAQA